MVKGKCCNPFNHEGHNYYQYLRNITDDIIEKAKSLNYEIEKSADGICQSCHSTLYEKSRKRKADDDLGESSTARRPTGESSTAQAQTDFQYKSESENSGDELLEEFNLDDFDDDDRKDIKEATNALLVELKLPMIEGDEFRSAKNQTKVLNELNKRLRLLLFTKVSDEDENHQIIEQLKEKMDQTTLRDTKIKILSVLPKEWSAQKIQKIFGENVTIHMINKTKELVAKNGILCGTSKKIGSKTIEESTVKNVVTFYNSDDISRYTPGRRDYVLKANAESKRVPIQSRLVLMNLREAFELFKEDYPADKIGFSKFCALRPIECELADSTHGIHNICVCKYHQNVKLIFDALKKSGLFKDSKSYRDPMNMLLCKDTKEECYLKICGTCPGFYGESGPCQELRFQFELESTERITYMQWSNKRCKFRCEING